MKTNTLYVNAHLFVAALRILEHRRNTPPTVESVSEFLSFSLEQGHLVCRRLADLGVVTTVEAGGGSPRLLLQDHLRIEEIPKDETESHLEKELKRFQESRKGLNRRIEAIKAEQAEKKKHRFAEIEEKLKREIEGK